MPRRWALVFCVMLPLTACAVARGPAPGHPPFCLAIGQAHAQAGSASGVFFGKPTSTCHADGGSISMTMELLLAGIVTTLGSLALAGVL